MEEMADDQRPRPLSNRRIISLVAMIPTHFPPVGFHTLFNVARPSVDRTLDRRLARVDASTPSVVRAPPFKWKDTVQYLDGACQSRPHVSCHTTLKMSDHRSTRS